MTRVTRFVLYPLLFACSSVLLGLTAYRTHYTKSLSNGDILTSRSHFYDPRIVALMAASIVALLFSVAMLGLMFGSMNIVLGENISLWILWLFFLITAALVTGEFSNLRYCRSHKVCSVLEAIKSFGWICWGILSILAIVTLVDLMESSESRGDRNTRGGAVANPQHNTRQTTTTTGTTVHDQPRTQTPQGVPTSTTHAKQNTSSPHDARELV